MTYSEIKITFTEDLAIGTELKVVQNFEGSETSPFWIEKWVGKRISTNKVTTGLPTSNIGERSAINFVSAFLLDYNFPVQYEVSRIVNEVTIKSMIPEQTFVYGEVLLDDVILYTVDFDITNFTGTIYKIEEQTFSEASTDQCIKVKINIETSVLTTKIISPFVLEGNTENPFSFDWFRGQQINVVCENADEEQLNFTIITPDSLNVANFNFTISNTPNGGTLVIEKINSNGLDVEYSLDDETWQEEEFFNGLEPGAYTLYVKDQLGCSFSVGFSVNEFGIQDPIFYLSKSNSIRFAERIDFNVSGNYKTDENTLSCEDDVDVPYMELQQFNAADEITIQFKSNYAEHEVNAIKSNDDEVNIPVYKKTSNIGLKEKRDAIIYRYSKFKSGIYFINGNIYDYDTNVINGDYVLNGLLPQWAKAGNYILVGSTWYQIEQVVYVESKNADVLVINRVTTGLTPSAVIVGSIFNLQDYDVYEFIVNMADFNNEDIRIRINANDDSFDDLVFLSEKINVNTKQDGTLEVLYFNIDNNDVFYQTGIKHLMRLRITQIDGKFDDSSNTNKTDNSVVLLNATLYEGDEFIFEPVTKQMMRKIVIALSHKFVYLDGQGYVKSNEIEVEGPLDKSNLYVVKAKMLKTGTVYTNKPTGTIQLFNEDNIEIPGLIEWDGGFIEQ